MIHGNLAESVLAALGIDRYDSLDPVTGGADALLWRVRIDTNLFALRVLRADQLIQAEREMLLMRWVSTHGIPAPTVIESGICQDRPAYLMEWLDGETLGSALTGGLVKGDMLQNLMLDFGATQGRIHGIQPPTDLEPAAHFLSRHGSEHDLQSRLERETPGEPALLHLDYHPLNVMVNNDAVSAVLDWANARLGDRRFDLARTRAIIELAPTMDPTVLSFIPHAIALWNEGYERVAGAMVIPPVFRWWAARFIEHDLSNKLGNPAVPWLTEDYVTRIRAYADEARLQTFASE